MYPPHSLGGYEVIWRSAVGDFRDAGHDVRVLTTDHREAGREGAPEDPDVHRELRWYWSDHDFPPMTMLERLRLERHNRKVLSRHLAEHRPDVVSWWAMGGMSLGMIEQVRLRGLPAVGVVCDDWMVYGPKVDAWVRAFSTRRPLARAAEQATRLPTEADLSAAATWLFISQFCLERAAAEGGHQLRSTAVAHAGIDPERFTPGPEGEWSGRLLYAGRIDERKGIQDAIESVARLDESVRLDVVGGGDEGHRAELEDLVAKLGLHDRVKLSGGVAQDELSGLYSSADALVFPVRWPEPWGLVPLEAMACGTPVIATGTGGSGEYLRHENNCLLVEAKAPDAIAAAVRRLAEDAALRGRLRSGGLETAAKYTEQAYNQTVRLHHERLAEDRDAAA